MSYPEESSKPAAIVAMGLWAALFLVGCSGGGSADESISVRLASDQDCYGLAMEIDQHGLASPDLGSADDCTADPAVIALGCETSTSTSAGRYGLSASGCFVPDNTPLFNCKVPKDLASRFREAAQLRCGCGCATDCPASTGALVCDADGANCDHTRATVAFGGPTPMKGPVTAQVTSGNVQVTTVSSTTTYCGTCCDAQDIDTGVKLADDSSVREIRFDLAMNIDEPACPDFNGCSVATPFDGPSIVTFDGDMIHVCLSAKSAVDGPVHLLSCSVNSDGTDEYEIANISALDQDFMSVVPDPHIINDFGAP